MNTCRRHLIRGRSEEGPSSFVVAGRSEEGPSSFVVAGHASSGSLRNAVDDPWRAAGGVEVVDEAHPTATVHQPVRETRIEHSRRLAAEAVPAEHVALTQLT